MAFKKMYHTHLNPAGDPLFLVIEGSTCEDCEKNHDKISGNTPASRLQTPEHNVAEGKVPKRKRIHLLPRLRGKNQIQHRNVDKGRSVRKRKTEIKDATKNSI